MDGRLMKLKYAEIPAQLRERVPGFDRVYEEHLRDNDDVLPHVLFGDLVRFLYEEARTHGAKSIALREAMALLEGAMASQDPMLQELLAVSFLENLDPREAGFSTIRALFGPRLEAQYRSMEE